MPLFSVKMRPAKGDPQSFSDGGVTRRYMRDLTFEAEDRDAARQIAERQAWDIAETEETKRYVVESVKEVS